MEKKTDGLVLRSNDYRENDKLLTVLTAKYGKLTVAARGVKKAGAKLRFAAQPFCFAEFVLAERGGRHTLVSASCHESFFALWTEAIYPASAVLEIADAVASEGAVCTDFFLHTVEALRNMTAGDVKEALAAYLLCALDECGIPVDTGRCFLCGRELTAPKTYFYFPTGSFSCAACAKGVGAAYETYLLLRRLRFGGAGESEEETKRRALSLLKEYLSYKTEIGSRCLKEYLRQLSR